MKGQKALTAALCCCVLALCVAIGIATHFRQESREAAAQLTAAQAQITALEVQLSQTQAQLTQAEEARDYAQRRYESASHRDNPIDRYLLSPNRIAAFSTYEINMEAWFEYEAWKREFECALAWVEKDCETVYEADRQLLKDYQAAIVAQAETMDELTHLHVAGLFPPEELRGRVGSWGGCAISYAEAEVYRQGIIHLLDTYAYAMEKSSYPYSFDEDVRKEIVEEIATNNESVRETLEQLFPPLSEVLPDQS